MAHIGTLPIDCDLVHGDLNLGTITLGIPLKAGDIETGDDGKQYVTLSPDVTDGWLERALVDAVATLSGDNVATATVTELTRNQAGADQ